MPRPVLTGPQREALMLAEQGQLTEKNARRAVLDTLWGRGWITWRNPRLRFTGRAYLTPEGRDALYPPPGLREQRDVFLTAKPATVKADYTTDLSRGMIDAGPTLEPEILARFTRKARDKEQEQRDARIAAEQQARDLLALENRIVKAAQLAQDRGVNVRREMDALKRTLQRNPSPAVKDATVRRLKMVERVIDTRTRQAA